MRLTACTFVLLLFSAGGFAQAKLPGSGISGIVTLKESGLPIANADVSIAELKRSVQTGGDGRYAFENVPAGKYEVIVRLERIADAVKSVEVAGGSVAPLDFELRLNSVNEQVTITATGSAESVNSSYQAVTTVGALTLGAANTLSIGEALKEQPGIANRSFGPGSGRPVVRGFDGDRVLVLQDGLRIGGISGQSGDEAEPIDVLALDRIEIVKGPATLLYGSNAIGGVVNGISTNDVYHKGFSGYLTAIGGTNNWQGGGSGGVKAGFRNFLFYANGGAQKANDYRTSAGIVPNSYARTGNASGGAGYFRPRGWLSFTYGDDYRRYGIPTEPGEIDLEYYKTRRRSYEVKGGLRGFGRFIEGGDFALNYNDYTAREFEFESDENITEFEGFATNKNLNYRLNLNQKRRGRLSGTFGFSGFTRDFESVGAEAPAPRTKQNTIAVYGLERVDFERVGFQFGARVERTGYRPGGGLAARSFVGFSGSAGVRIPLWTGGSFVANYQHSFRAPALEELYNNGPHPGLVEFDIANPDLRAERGDGLDVSLRHKSERFRIDGGIFYYRLRDFAYPALTGEVDSETELFKVKYLQGNSRYAGLDTSFQVKLFDSLWLDAKADYVRADLTNLRKSLPRIPPFRSTLGLDWSYKSLSIRPEVVMSAPQRRVYDNETPTAGYAIFNLNASYAIFTRETAHIFSLGAYNLTDRLYLNHLSLLKDIAPEIGRGVRLTYSLRF